MPRLVALEDVVEDARPTRLGEKLGAKADQAARRHDVLHPHPAGAVIDHLRQPPLAKREELRDHADVVLGRVDGQALDGLVQLPVDLARDDLRLADGELEPLAAHQLDEHGELELAATLHLPGVGALGGEHAQRHVADELLVEPRLHHARRQAVSVLARERGRVDPDRHRQARLVDPDHRERPRVVRIGEGLADGHVGEARDGDQLAGTGLGGVDPVERLGHVQLRDLRPLDAPVGAAPRDLLAVPDRPLADPAEREPADVRGGVEVRDVCLKRVALRVRGSRDVLEQGLEERLEIRGQRIRLQPGLPGSRVRIDDRKLDLALVGVQVEEERVDLVDDLGDTCVRPVDLVHDEDRREPGLERLAEHEAGLRERPLARIDEEEDAVHHRQPALDLASEVRVARRVDDVDLHAPVAHGRVLGQDRDALLALEVHGVEDALGHVLVLPEGAGLPEHRVDERRLPVVDVGDDGDVADVFARGHPPRVAARGSLPVVPVSTRRARLGR